VRPAARARFDHVAFDLDGTLVDSRADLAASVNHVLRTMRLPELAPETLYRYVGEGARVLVERALGPTRAQRVDEGFALFMEYYGAHLLDATRPYPGLVDVLDAAAARGVALSVLTNKPIAFSRSILDGLGITPRLVGVIGSDSLPVRKPDPAGLDALRALSNTSRERTLLVGDSNIDVATARAGGVAFCGVGWGLSPEALVAAGPERIVDDAAELLAVIERGTEPDA
jgi:phosphoglycolate phosphatase